MSDGAPAGNELKGPGRCPGADYGQRNDAGQSRCGEAVAADLRSEPVKSGCQDVGDHAGSEGVPVIRSIARPHTRRIDGHDEIAAGCDVTGHAERTVLARDVEVKVLAIDATAGNTYPQQRRRTDALGHEEIGGDPFAAGGRDGAHVHVDTGPAYGEHLCVGSRSKHRFRILLRHAQRRSAERALATYGAPSGPRQCSALLPMAEFSCEAPSLS